MAEEIIIVDEDTGKVISYCSIIERAALTLKTFNPYKRERSRKTWQAFFMFFRYTLYNGLNLLESFEKSNIYYGDFKRENFLLTFGTMKLTLSDFGTSFIIKETEENYLTGLTR